MNIILLSGGSGTRLWPLSNEVRSKQFLKIFRDEQGNHESMVQRMYRMIRETIPDAVITIATSKAQVGSIKNQLSNSVNLSIEPCRRDTFPAIALSVAYLHDIKGVPEDESVVVCPVDPLVDKGYFEILNKLYEESKHANLCLMGIKPTYPSEKYGYIIQKDKSVLFKEKPSLDLAKEYLNEGALWNGGVFAFKVGFLLDKAKELCGDSKYERLLNNYENLRKISFDYAVAEHERSIKVIEYSGEWKDLGTWNTFTEAMKEAISDNVILGENCENVHVVNELSVPVIGLGLKDVIIAASPDGILVSDKHSSSYLKKYVPEHRPMFEKREWGEYKILDYQSHEDGTKVLTKQMVVQPLKSISYQSHQHRLEIWTITKGNGQLLINGLVRTIKAGDNVKINREDRYSVRALDELHILEIQIGDELIEEDIEKFPWEWDA